MIVFIVVLVASTTGVIAERRVIPTYTPGSSGPFNPILFTTEQCVIPPIFSKPYEGFIATTQTSMPVSVPDRPMIIPFINELPSCPDLCFKDIMLSPLGCLDPILTAYSPVSICPLPDMPVGPLFPATSPFSDLAVPFAGLLPPVTGCECLNSFLRRVPIPPPFI